MKRKLPAVFFLVLAVALTPVRSARAETPAATYPFADRVR